MFKSMFRMTVVITKIKKCSIELFSMFLVSSGAWNRMDTNLEVNAIENMKFDVVLLRRFPNLENCLHIRTLYSS